jgi:hypothetical protein
MKTVIVVKGSEDGVLGVATNKKQAIKVAHRSGYKFASYSKLLKGETTQDDGEEYQAVEINFEEFQVN